MHLQVSNLLALITFALAQAPTPSGRPAPAAPAASPPDSAPLEPAPAPAAPVQAANPLVSMIHSAFNDPALKATQSAAKPTTTYTKEPASFALSDIEFGSTLVAAPRLPTATINPIDPDSTPGEVRFCTGAAYASWNGDSAGAVCDSVQSELNTCGNLSAALRRRVVAVRPDQGQLCLLFDDADCFGKAEWVKWPGVRNLRGRIGDGGGWANRVVSFRCTGES